VRKVGVLQAAQQRPHKAVDAAAVGEVVVAAEQRSYHLQDLRRGSRMESPI
jgi:hypothetical protein